jgi:ABC-2 type transport system ATP-binding protein
VLDIALRRPTLDDVFLSLTGHRADGENADGENADGEDTT